MDINFKILKIFALKNFKINIHQCCLLPPVRGRGAHAWQSSFESQQRGQAAVAQRRPDCQIRQTLHRHWWSVSKNLNFYFFLFFFEGLYFQERKGCVPGSF